MAKITSKIERIIVNIYLLKCFKTNQYFLNLIQNGDGNG
jgi:hypothetical protein